MSKIRNSDRIVAEILGPAFVSRFEITGRRASSGVPTFALWWTDEGHRMRITSESPLARVRELLREIATTNDLRVGQLSKILAESFAAYYFTPEQLQGNCGFHWCVSCGGLQKGRVVTDNDGSYIAQREGDDLLYGYYAEICACPGVEPDVEVVLGRYGIVIDELTLNGLPPVVRMTNGKWGSNIRTNIDPSRVQEIGSFQMWSEARMAARREMEAAQRIAGSV